MLSSSVTMPSQLYPVSIMANVIEAVATDESEATVRRREVRAGSKKKEKIRERWKKGIEKKETWLTVVRGMFG